MNRVIIIRHQKENTKKCSLKTLQHRKDFLFLKYPRDKNHPLEQGFLLGFEGPVLTKFDDHKPLVLLDGTWKLASVMSRNIDGSKLEKRSLPSLVTSYPRAQTLCEKPYEGLASIEALACAFKILGYDYLNLLKGYFWKDDFIKKNHLFFNGNPKAN